MNANRKRIIDFRINGRHDHYINKDKHAQPHMPKDLATKPKRFIYQSVEADKEGR